MDMKRILRFSSVPAAIASAVAFILFAVPAGMLHAQAMIKPIHPAGVPDNFVATPFGYFHPSCILHLAEGDTLQKDRLSILHADGSIRSFSSCAYAHYTASGKAVDSNATNVNSPTINGWVESASVSTSSAYGELVATWIVPPAPTASDGQIVYFFPGAEDDDGVKTIIQPVLGWNMAGTGGRAWSIASWNCCVSGIVSESTPVGVSVGDTIQGTIRSTCGAGVLLCPTWNITTYDETSRKSTSLTGTSSDGQIFDWAFGGVLEAYNIVQCSDYPPNGALTFSNIALDDDNFQLISNPAWSATYWTSGTPQCSYKVTTTATSVTLQYGQLQAAAPNVALTTTPQGPYNCGNQLAGFNEPCYMVFSTTVTVGAGESLYVNGTYSGTSYSGSVTESWGSGQCQNTPVGYLCFGYATPSGTAYATEPGFINSATVNIY